MTQNLTSQDGLYEIVGSTWDHNGGHSVTVREMIGERPNSGSQSWNDKRVRKARDLARRIDSDKAKWTRLNSEYFVEGSTHWNFTVSRLDPSYR